MAADGVLKFGIEQEVALISHSTSAPAMRRRPLKMRQSAGTEFAPRRPELDIDGEMHGDSALGTKRFRKAALPEQP